MINFPIIPTIPVLQRKPNDEQDKKGMIMGWGFFICQTDCKNRKRLSEFWLHKNFIGVHYHGWVDLNQKKLAESCTRHRKFKDNYYVAMETIIPFYVIRKIIFSPRVLWELTKWFIRAWRYNNRNK